VFQELFEVLVVGVVDLDVEQGERILQNLAQNLVFLGSEFDRCHRFRSFRCGAAAGAAPVLRQRYSLPGEAQKPS
jgi:hypothetical protein